MDDEFKDLSKWVYYSARFLLYCDRPEDESVKKVIRDFCAEERIIEPEKYKTWNQGSVLMTLYGIFVIPKEFWRNSLGDDDNEKVLADQLIFEDFEFRSKGNFTWNIPDPSIADDVFLRRFRNSLTNSNFEVLKESNSIRFWNKKQGVVNFDVTSSTQNLANFLTEISPILFKHN